MSQSIPHGGQKLALSRFAQRLLAARPELAAELADPQPFSRAEMLDALRCRADDELARELRRLRARVLLRVMARDLAGLAALEEVCGTMSDLAEIAIEAALGAEQLMVVGMGKLGGRELNVSSDVDLVFLYRESAEAQERYERAGRRLIRRLSETTAEGFVFRVDMRLRPYGDSGPLACNLEALEQYFITQGREWERYAWLKARAITAPGGGSALRELDAVVRPFVFRKYLDYGAFGALRALHAEVRRDVERRELAEHVKLGPGGIREIEFIVQALQLVRGGRDPELRVRATLEALRILARKSLLPESAARELSDAYVFLRTLEHRLQYLDDAQRHDLPEDEEDRSRVAAMCGFASWGAFHACWRAVRASVSRHFLDVFAEPSAPPRPWPQHPRLAALRASQRYAALPEESRRRLDRLVPALARAAQGTPDAEATLARAVDLVEAIASRAAYLALLAEHPEALERVARMIGASSWAAEYVTRHPLLLDELLDDRVLYAPPDWVAFSESLKGQLAAAHDDTERRMNILREMHQAQVFRLLAQDLAGLLTVEKLADHLSALADLMLQACIDEVWHELRGRHREAPRFAVIGYGKLGGKELGYASDLDIIFLYDDDDERAPEVYARLAQRLNTWVSSRTSSGILFETDLELRPSGASGLLVSSIAAFERYQNESAWVWEHQALTRARYCAGDADVGDKFEAIRQRILTRKRDPKPLKAEILAMRDKLHAAHPNTSGLFDVKHDAGGMIDIEFAVQFLVLGFSSEFPSLTGNLGNIALLSMAADHGLIPAELAERCRNAYREFRRIQHSLRLNGARYARVPRERVAAETEAVRMLWQAVF
ncbi:MAG TPA: bifunctional [glutamate--ammonia ligase]-adenylyl-L-tyrosine phosphorylase/[glutamate--ammonia-ligase] adenylyltransferase, partial [Burkholderiales bacterium]|nr:bifunctional [glutamate--ammonia ligase]-adenylyl-L-tyrosine phosphorylase/[glutamate--ammonia-ligase] adenylyltransferase [Burkholderiales bacterium]